MIFSKHVQKVQYVIDDLYPKGECGPLSTTSYLYHFTSCKVLHEENISLQSP